MSDGMGHKNLETLKNAKKFAYVLSKNGIKSCLINENFFPAQHVIVEWNHPEGALSASCRLAKVGIYAKAIHLAGDKGNMPGLHFSLTG